MKRSNSHTARAVFMAFGTQGDVLPLMALAVGLAKKKQDCSIFFITHTAHESLRRSLLSFGITYIPITSPPVVSAERMKSLVGKDNSGDNGLSEQSEAWKRDIENQHRQECLEAVDSVIGSEVRENRDFIVINLFALDGWHLAELYQVPCVVAAPYVVPYSAPASFERKFRTRYPTLYEVLKRNIPGKVGWDHVIHWMWPLFGDRWCDWRMKELHLSACPLTDPVTELPVVETWPHEPLLLYGFSKDVVECPSYWPRNVHACGFWFWERNNHNQDSNCLKLEGFIRECDSPPIFVGLSSIGSMGFLDNPEGMLSVLAAALESTQRQAILFTASYQPLDAAVIAATNEDSISGKCQADKELKSLSKGIRLFNGKLFCFSGIVSYLWLFPQCSLVIHHGGSGTTAAALQSGIPQVVCPFILDQFYWAERMAWMGVSPEPLAKAHFIPPSNLEIETAVRHVSSAIMKASSPELQLRAANLGKALREEDGVTNAIEILCQQMGI